MNRPFIPNGAWLGYGKIPRFAFAATFSSGNTSNRFWAPTPSSALPELIGRFDVRHPLGRVVLVDDRAVDDAVLAVAGHASDAPKRPRFQSPEKRRLFRGWPHSMRRCSMRSNSTACSPASCGGVSAMRRMSLSVWL